MHASEQSPARKSEGMKLASLLMALGGLASGGAARAGGVHSTGVHVVADCSLDPTRALYSAVASLRTARAGSTATRATLTIRGLCRLAAPLELDERDSNVQWIGERGAVISGGIH